MKSLEVEIIDRIPFQELAEKVRKIPLLKSDPPVHPYREAMVSLRESYTNESNLLTLYLLRENVEFQRRLREALLRSYGIDTLALTEGLTIDVDGRIWGLIPPIIELTPRKVNFVPGQLERACDKDVVLQIPILLDGVHRAWLAREMQRPFNAIYISGSDSRYPPYAYPNEWEKVKVVEEAPAHQEDKKLYCVENPYTLYRDFGILGCGAPRDPGVRING